MPDINPTLDLRQIVYHDNIPFYVVGMKIVSTSTANKVVYQISQDLPDMHGIRRGVWPDQISYFDREDLLTETEYAAARMTALETEANTYERTLTGVPIISLNTGILESYQFVWDGTDAYEWDGESFPPYENPIAAGTSWFDWIGTSLIATLTDIEDGGGAGILAPINHTANISWNGMTLEIDDASFTLLHSITDTFDGVTTTVTDVDVTTLGVYNISMVVVDSQGIYSYPLVIRIEVVEPPVEPDAEC